MGSTTYRHATGTRLTGANAKIISSISAAGVVTATTSWGASLPAVGEIVEMFGAGVPNHNKGFYAVIAASGADLTLAPKPRAQGTSTVTGIAKTTQNTLYTITGAGNVTEIIALDPPLAYFRVSDANFKDAGVKRNDRVQILGSSTTGNNGLWVIHEVLNNTTLILRPYDNGEMLQTQSASGTFIVREGRVRVQVNNVANNSWSRIASEGVPRNGPYASKFYKFCSGKITDYVRIHTIGDTPGETKTFVELSGVIAVDFYLSAIRRPTFYSLNEIVVVTHTTGTQGDCSFASINPNVWPGVLTVELGDNTGNRYSAGNGSAWVGLNADIGAGGANTKVNLYGSYLDGTGINEIFINEGNVIGSIVRPRLNTGTGLIESVICYGDSGNASGGLSGAGSGDQDNILVSKQGTTNTSFNAACVVGGLLVSDKLFPLNPFNNNVSGASGSIEIRDPRVDFDLSDYFSNTNADGLVLKTYQFNPRFVSSDSPTITPVPVFYLTVDVIEINETDLSVVSVIHDTTNLEGRLVGGARFLTRQTLFGSSEIPTLFSHRVILSGAGLRRKDDTIQITAPITGDRAVDKISPDYESEFGE